MSEPMLVLASKSAARRVMLTAAGITIKCVAPNVDENALKDGLKAEGISARNLADTLAEAKSVRLSRRMGPALVLGADQVLARDDGMIFDKPENPSDAISQLKMLSGRKHKLFSAAVVSDQGSPIWRHIDVATLNMRELSDEFIEAYVHNEWNSIQHCVGCYEIEGRGVQLFSDISGSQFTIMGLPLLHLLAFLRIRGVLPS